MQWKNSKEEIEEDEFSSRFLTSEYFKDLYDIRYLFFHLESWWKRIRRHHIPRICIPKKSIIVVIIHGFFLLHGNTNKANKDTNDNNCY